ncbi:Zn-ribbon domain-containing OB-fold protein [Halorientalis brevis]|uniref:Zn-ribbon domain-containing OB-fold protein n=1 Tax=Halorientalis brevis TaxID=1126241 RepID=A0ABD6CD77_9EURY|nr:OB-fold domain-containing protein [Halorientalis brevis]
MTDASDGAFSAFLDAIEAGDPYYLVCPESHGSIPPQQLCPECHSRDLSKTPLSESGEIETYTVVSVPAPRFSDDSPYVTAIADFGPVTLTGHLRGVDPDAVEIGQTVRLAVGSADGERFVAFEQPE